MDKHHDHHHNHSLITDNVNRAFYIGIALNASFTLVEFIVGIQTESLALLSDATHNLSDVASLIISLIGMRLARKVASQAYTYGFKKASLLASLINAVFLLIVVIGIFREAVERFNAPQAVEGDVIMIVAGIGVAINAISAFLFVKGQKSDINIRGAYMHLLVDALVSVGVVVSGLLIRVTGYSYIDPAISIVIGIVIFITTWGLFKESIRLVIDAVPREMDVANISGKMEEVEGVESVHHVHVWALSSTQNALSAHVVVKPENINKWSSIRKELAHVLEHQNVHHVTFEQEYNDNCNAKDC